MKLFKARTLVLANMHQKERAIAPLLTQEMWSYHLTLTPINLARLPAKLNVWVRN